MKKIIENLIFCQDGDKRTVEVPEMVLTNDTDVEHLSKALATAYSFLCGDIDLNEAE